MLDRQLLSLGGLLFVCFELYQFEVIVVLLISVLLSILAIIGTVKVSLIILNSI